MAPRDGMPSFIDTVEMSNELVLVGAALDWLQPADLDLRLQLRWAWLPHLLMLGEHETALWQHWLDVFCGEGQ